MDDRELVRAIATARDRRAFAELCRSYAPRLVAFLRGRGGSAEHAEELVQEVMLTVWVRASSYDPQVAAVSTWIFTIARNRSVDGFRRQQRPEVDPNDPALVPDTSSDPEGAIDRADRAEALRRALGELPEEQARVVKGVYLEQRSMPELAGDEGIALGTVKSRMRLALRALRSRLGIIGEEERPDGR